MLAAPDVGRNSPRLPGEFSTCRVKARLGSMKIDSAVTSTERRGGDP